MTTTRAIAIGGFSGTVDFGGEPLVAPANGDAFVLKCAAQGKYL